MRHLLLSVLLGTVFSVSAFAQAPGNVPALQVTRPIYAWKTENDTNKKTGAFNHCLVKNMYDNGTVLMLAENYEGVKRLALNFPQDKMAAGDHFDLTLQVDKRDVFPVEAVAISPQILTIGIPEALPDQMRKGQAMYLRGPNDEVVYTMDGADGAVTALQDCVATQKGQATQLQTADAAQDPAPIEPVTAPDTITALKTEPAPVAQIAAPVAAQSAAPTATQPVTPAKPSAVATAFENFKNKLPGLGEEKKIEVADEASLNAPVKPLPASPEALAKASVAPIASAEPVAVVAAKEQKAAPVVAPPVAPAPSAPAPAIAGAAPVVAVAPPSLPADLKAAFEKAGFAPTAFISTPEQNKTSKRPLDYAWMKDDLFIGTKEQNSVPDAGMTKASVYYLGMLKQRCTGPFVAEAGNIVKTPTLSTLVVEAACSPGTKDDTIAALLFANDAKNLRIYFFEAPATSGAKAIKARDAVLKVLKSNQ